MIKKADIILIVSLAILAFLAALFPFLNTSGGKELIVLINNEEVHRLPLASDTRIDLTTNVIVVKNGKAYVEKANCPDKVCVHHKPIFRRGESIICVPNRIVLEVE